MDQRMKITVRGLVFLAINLVLTLGVLLWLFFEDSHRAWHTWQSVVMILSFSALLGIIVWLTVQHMRLHSIKVKQSVG